MAPDKNTGIGSSVRPPGRWGGHLRCLPARWERGGEPSPGDSDEFSDSVSRHQPVRRHMRQSQRPPGRRPSRRQRRRRPSSLPGPPSRLRTIYGRGKPSYRPGAGTLTRRSRARSTRTVMPVRGQPCRLCWPGPGPAPGWPQDHQQGDGQVSPWRPWDHAVRVPAVVSASFFPDLRAGLS